MKYLTLIAFSAILLAACSNDESTDTIVPTTPNVGTFIDSPVFGIDYTTSSYSGKTDEMGRFNYNTGESVQFSIGDIILPYTTADNIVHITKIFNTNINDQRVINLARLLLTLDEDQNPDNGISIGASAFSASIGTNIDFSSSSFETDVINYLSNAGGSVVLIPEIDAVNHIQETLAEANNFTSEDEDALLYDCDTECVQRANYNDFVVNFFPRHQQINVPVDTKITVAIDAEANTGTGEFNVELFPIKPNADRCRMGQGGFICGDDEPYDTRAAWANIVNGIEHLDGKVSLNPVIFGTANIDINNNVVFTPERNLTSGVTYVVHVFANEGFTDFQTWWIFKT
jgi:hypothetical protein